MDAAGILVTRPEPGCSETCAALRARFLVPVAAPLLHIAPVAALAWPPVPRPAAILATSRNAIVARAPVPGVALFAVGDRTASDARARGWADVRSAAGDAGRLAALCQTELDPRAGPLRLLAGAGQGAALAAALRAGGFGVEIETAYLQQECAAFPAEAAAALAAGTLRAALFLSGSASRAFVRLLPATLRASLAGVEALAISDAAASPLASLPWRRVRVALRPTSEDVLALL